MRLTLHNIGKAFGDNRLFEGLDLEINSGEFVCLIGRSGLGKTTLLNLMGSFDQPDVGTVMVDGQPVTRPGLDRIMVFQTFDQLLPWKTVEENLLFPTRHTQKTGMDPEMILKRLELEDVRNHYPHQLSGGMKQRVALGRALVVKPGILLMDEPFGSLDVATRQSMHRLMIEVWKEFKVTVVFITHDVTEAVKLGERILILSEGTLMDLRNPIPFPRDERAVNFQYFQNEIIQRIK